MEVYFRTPTPDLELAIEVAIDTAQARINERLDNGAGVVTRSMTTWDMLPSRLEKAIKGFDKRKPFPDNWSDFLTEIPLPDQGHARPDLLLNSPHGPTILDFKTKITAKEWTIDDFISDFEYSWQMYHYIWACREAGIAVANFALCLAIIEPLKFYIEQFAVDENYLESWVESAEYWWRQMEEAEENNHFPKSGVHRDQYGQCPMYRYCLLGQKHEYSRE